MDEIYRLKRWDETENGYVDFLPFYPDDDNEASKIQNSQGLIPSVERVLTNTSNIATLNTKVETNTSNIANLTTKVETNTSNIGTNTSNIATLNTKVETNTSNIANLTTKVETNTSNIGTNTSNIANLTTKVETNTSNIGTNTSNIADLNKQINGDKDSETTGLADQINTNTENINTNINNIADLNKQINGDKNSETPVLGLVDQINTNAENINNLATKVDTNTSNISTNASNITDLAAKVDTNTSNIANDISSVTVHGFTDNGGVLTLTSNENNNNVTITAMGVAKDPSNKTCTITPYTSKIKVIGCNNNTLGLTKPDGNTLNIATPESSTMCIDPNICTPTEKYLYLGGSSNDTTNKWDRLYLYTKTNKLSVQKQSIKTTYPIQMHAARFVMHTPSTATTGVNIGETGKCIPLEFVRSTSALSVAELDNSENNSDTNLFTLKRSWAASEDTAEHRGVQVNYSGHYLISARVYVTNLTAGKNVTLTLQKWDNTSQKIVQLGGSIETRQPSAADTAYLQLPPGLYYLSKGDRVGIRVGTYGSTGLVPAPTSDIEAAKNCLEIVCYNIGSAD